MYVDHVAADGAFSDLADERVGAGDPIERLRVIDAERARQHDTAGLLAFSALTASSSLWVLARLLQWALLVSFAGVASKWADAAGGALAARSTRVFAAECSTRLSASTSQQCHRGRSKDTSSDSLEDLPPRNGDGRRPRQIVKLPLAHRRSPSVTTVSILGSVVARCTGVLRDVRTPCPVGEPGCGWRSALGSSPTSVPPMRATCWRSPLVSWPARPEPVRGWPRPPQRPARQSSRCYRRAPPSVCPPRRTCARG